MNHYDYDEVARVAMQAARDGRSAALAIAAHYGIEESNARHVITKARARGHAIPYARQGGARVMEPRKVELQFTPEPWMDYAACRDLDPDIFFPGAGSEGNEAKKVCAVCPCKKSCLDYALRTEIKHGIWGGTSERERRALRREYKRNWRERVA